MIRKAQTQGQGSGKSTDEDREQYSKPGKYMALSLRGSSHLPLSVIRSQFLAMVPSLKSEIIQKANHRAPAAHQP